MTAKFRASIRLRYKDTRIVTRNAPKSPGSFEKRGPGLNIFTPFTRKKHTIDCSKSGRIALLTLSLARNFSSRQELISCLLSMHELFFHLHE